MCEVLSTEDQCMYQKIYKQNMYKVHRCFLRVPVVKLQSNSSNGYIITAMFNHNTDLSIRASSKSGVTA